MRRHVSLRLLAFLAVAACAGLGRADENEDRILEHVKKIGGKFTRETVGSLYNQITISLYGTAATDGDLEVVGGFRNLQALELQSTKITDQELRYLGGIERLRQELPRCQVYYSGKKELARDPCKER